MTSSQLPDTSESLNQDDRGEVAKVLYHYNLRFWGKGDSKTPSFVCSLKIEEVSTEQPTDVPEREELRDQEPAHPSNEVATEEPATSVSVNVHEC